MADFNPATMLNVAQDYYCSFAATRSGTDLLVTAKQYGDLLPGMVVTGAGITPFVVQERLTASGSELERWKTFNLYADFDASLSGTTLTVTQVRTGTITVDCRISLSIDNEYWWGITSQVSGTAGGVGTYTLSGGYGVNDGLNYSEARWFSYYYNAGETVSSATAMSGILYKASTTAATSGAGVALARFGCAARYASKALYFPPGRYTVGTGVAQGSPGSLYVSARPALYGASSQGQSRTVLQADYNTAIWVNEFNPTKLADLRIEGIRVNACDNVKGCYIWMPDNITTFTGRVTGTTLTVETLPANGFVTVGSVLTQGEPPLGTVTALLSGTPNVAGCTFSISASQSVATGTSLTASVDLEAGSYFITASGSHIEMVDNVWDLPGMYVAVYIPEPVDVVFDRNQFRKRRGRTWHVVLCVGGSALGKRFEFTRNLIDRRCTTGIFVKSSRIAAIRNLVMDWNEVHGNEEEALSLDGIGNDAGQTPCIANGRLTTVSNAADGRLVISMAQMVYRHDGATVLSPVSTRCSTVQGYVSGDLLTVTATINHAVALGATLKGAGVPEGTRIMERVSGTGLSGSTYRLNQSFVLGSSGSPVTNLRMGDWRNFVFVFSEGTGIDGAMADIYDFDETANTLTLDIIAPASDVTTGSATWAGVHSGFFGGSFCHNRITGHSKSGENINGDYATGISLYQNVFGIEAAYNEISGVANGINVIGSGSLGVYHLLAYHNSIHDNVVALSAPTRANGEVPSGISIQAILGGIAPRGNRVYNNILINAPLLLTASEDNLCEGNILVGTSKVLRPTSTPFYPPIPS